MARIKPKDTDTVSNIVQSISYGTGLICAKVSKLGKVTKTKGWKDVISKTQGMVKNVEKTVMDSVTDMKESFDEGVQSIVEEQQDIKSPKGASKKAKKDDAQEAEIVPHEEEIVDDEETIEEQKQEAAEIIEEIAVKKEEVAAQEVKEAQAYPPPLPSELAPETDVGGTEDLLEEPKKENTKKKAMVYKLKKKEEDKKDEAVETGNLSEFTIKEFKKDGKDPKGLMGSIRKNKPEIVLTSTDPLDWLNELLANGDNGQPLKYDIQQTPEITEAKAAFEGASGVEKNRQLIKLNRLILEQAYPLKCPKLDSEGGQNDSDETQANKTKSRRLKSSDSGLNLN